MYRRRVRRRRWLLVFVLLLTAAGVVWAMRSPKLRAEWIASPTATPVTPAYDQTVETREVTLAAETWYAIQTGVFSTKEAAEEKAAAYTDRGAPGTVIEQDGKWRVFIASYGAEAEAFAVRQRLGETQRVETYLYAWECPELRLRLTGMAGQLDVAQAGLTLLLQTAARLRDTAILLDAGQLTVEEAGQVIADVDGQITLWASTARDRFGRQMPELLQQMLALTDDWGTRKKTLTDAAASVTELSAALKGQGMEMYDDMIRLRNGFMAQ